MKKITILTLIIITLVIMGARIVNAEKTEYYQQYGHYYSTKGEGSIFIPENCSERDVKIATQFQGSNANRVRFLIDDSGRIISIINLTEDGNNSWGNVDPTGCWHTFQKTVNNQSYIWVGSTSSPKASWSISKGIHPDWNQVSGEIVFSDNGKLFTINMFGKNLKSLGLLGDYPKFFPNGKWLVFQRENKIHLNDVETVIGEGEFAIPFPDNLGVYIINNHEIIATSLDGKEMFKIRGENIAPDPRKETVFNIVEVEGELVIVPPNKTILEAKEPIWWVHISQR